MNTGTTVFQNFAINTDSTRLSLYTPPRGKPIVDSEHYTAFELSNEQSEGGFIAAVHAKRSNGRHTHNVTRYCFVRSVVADNLATLERVLKGR